MKKSTKKQLEALMLEDLLEAVLRHEDLVADALLHESNEHGKTMTKLHKAQQQCVKLRDGKYSDNN